MSGIIISPNAINISLNQEAVLSCKTVGEHISWTANGTSVYYVKHKDWMVSQLTEIVNSTQNIHLSKLKIRGTSNVNQTNLTCHVAQLSGNHYSNDESEPALVLVQGSYTCRKAHNHACNIVKPDPAPFYRVQDGVSLLCMHGIA